MLVCVQTPLERFQCSLFPPSTPLIHNHGPIETLESAHIQDNTLDIGNMHGHMYWTYKEEEIYLTVQTSSSH